MKSAKPIVASLAVVVKDKAVLLVRRRNQPDAGLWGFPGGKIRFGETMSDAARRELLEETSVQATPHRIHYPLEIIEHSHSESAYHFVLIPIFFLYGCGTPRPGDDAIEAAWIGYGELRSLETFMSFNVLQIAERAINELKGLPNR